MSPGGLSELSGRQDRRQYRGGSNAVAASRSPGLEPGLRCMLPDMPTGGNCSAVRQGTAECVHSGCHDGIAAGQQLRDGLRRTTGYFLRVVRRFCELTTEYTDEYLRSEDGRMRATL